MEEKRIDVEKKQEAVEVLATIGKYGTQDQIAMLAFLLGANFGKSIPA